MGVQEEKNMWELQHVSNSIMGLQSRMQDTGQPARVRSAGTKYVSEIWAAVGPRMTCGAKNILKPLK